MIRFETPPGRQAQVDFARFRFPWGIRYALLVVLGYGRTFLHDADLDQQRQAWLDRVANVRLHGTTRERPRDRFDREERFLLQPLAARRYTSLVVERPSHMPTRRPPRPMVVVEKRSLTAYAQLAGGGR